jgi:hypothetical protein
MSTPPPQASSKPRRASLWVKELPFTPVLALTILGVAYTSVPRQPIIIYWELLAPIIGVVCVTYGWASASDKAGRVRLISTKLIHWLAFLVVINLVFLPGVQRVLTANATGVAIFTLLTLGTFTAGVHVLSWQVCLLGLIMALGIPAIVWIGSSLPAFLELWPCFGGIGAKGGNLRNPPHSRSKNGEVTSMFSDQVKIDEAIATLRKLHSGHSIKLYASALVAKDPDGRLSAQ